MKRLFMILVAVLLTATMWAQSPQKMSYQAVIRDATNHLVTTQVAMRITILLGPLAPGTNVYVERQIATPNANGLVTIEINGPTVTHDFGTFASIDWSAGVYYIKTETDINPGDGSNYTITGTSQLLSVPYALHAKTAASYTETDPIYAVWNKSTGINITSSQVSDFQTSVTNNAAVLANTAKNSYPTTDQTKLAGIAAGANVGVMPNTLITGATKTKITYDAKGLVTAGTDATTADIAASTDKNYVSDAQLTVIGNTSGTNTGDNAVNTLYSGLVSNATHTGDVTGSEALTLATVNSNVGTFNNITINAKGLATAGSNVSYLTSETDPAVKAITGIIKSNGTTISAATAGTDYLTPTGSAASLTGFPTLNQNTTGSAASFTGSLAGEVTGTQGATVVSNAAVIGKVLSGYVSGAGTVAATDNILQAIQKLNGNIPAHYIGELYGGGIVVAVWKISGVEHGLIASLTNLGAVPWTTASYQTTYVPGLPYSLTDGLANSNAIVAQAGPGTTYAAGMCRAYSATGDGGLFDWYLPASCELNQLCNASLIVNAILGSTNGFQFGTYWSSNENLNNTAWMFYFSYFYMVNPSKSNTGYVRAVRRF